MTDWEEKILRDVFGTMRDNGLRQYKTVYIEIPKKNGKTEFCGGIGCYLLFGDGEYGAEIYSASNKRDQAAKCWDVAAHMVRNAPHLDKRAKVSPHRTRISIQSTNSFYQAIGSDSSSADGPNCHGILFDELHAVKNRAFFDTLTQGSGAARLQPLLFIITTAGNRRFGVGWDWHEKARQIISGKRIDPTVYAVIFGADKGDDWEDEEVWKKANPSLGQIISLDEMREHYNSVIGNPIEENEFKQKRLNIWVTQSIQWMPMLAWDKCAGKLPYLVGADCYAGLDLSEKEDLTCLSLVFPRPNKEYVIIPHFWLPREKAKEKERSEGIPYSIWERSGYITLLDEPTINYQYVRRALNEIRQIYNIKELAFDRYHAHLLRAELEDDGLTVIDFGQGYKSMSAPTKELLELVLNAKVNHGGNPILAWNADNVVVVKDPTNAVKPDKSKSSNKIDGIVATIMGLARASIHAEEPESIYASGKIEAWG